MYTTSFVLGSSFCVACDIFLCRVFVTDLLNFSFWSEHSDDQPKYAVRYGSGLIVDRLLHLFVLHSTER